MSKIIGIDLGTYKQLRSRDGRWKTHCYLQRGRKQNHLPL